jgi:hypothetical protein
MSKCIWCGKESHEIKEIMVLSTNPAVANRYEVALFVCPEHEGKLQGFYDRVRRYVLLFIVLTAILLLGLIVSAIFWDKYWWAGYLFSTSIAAMGLVLIVFPFCSQSTFNFMSIATSIKLARIMGGMLIAFGSILALSSFHG